MCWRATADLVAGTGIAAVGAAGCAVLWRPESVSTWCVFAAVCSVILLARPRPDPESPA